MTSIYAFSFFLQEDIEASLDNLQDIDMMDISVLDEAEIDNGNAVDCGEDYSADHILDSLSDSKENADAEMKELPDQPTDYAVGNLEASPEFSEIKEESREIPVMMVCISSVCGIRFFPVLCLFVSFCFSNSVVEQLLRSNWSHWGLYCFSSSLLFMPLRIWGSIILDF